MAPSEPHPLIALAALVILALGYLTFRRVVTRNVAADNYKDGLNRIRRHFVQLDAVPHRILDVAINPYGGTSRTPWKWNALPRGGWLETVGFVEAMVAGVFGAMVVPLGSWWTNGAVGALLAAATWYGLSEHANRLYTDKRKPE